MISKQAIEKVYDSKNNGPLPF